MEAHRTFRSWAACVVLAILAQLLVACRPLDNNHAATRLALRVVTGASTTFRRVELAIDTDGIYSNPFDPAQADLWVRFTGPSGENVRVPAFWQQDFDPATSEPAGPANWRARFTPGTPGQWLAQAELDGPGLRSAPLAFTVAAGVSVHGFVRVDSRNGRGFAFDDGTPFFPIGLNLGWSEAQGLGVLQDYQRWLDQLSKNGGTIGRVWMAAWSFGIEWKDTGLGNYTQRMQQAWLLDQIFAMAEQRGITLVLCLINHGQFSTTTNPEWSDNPYNQANGAMLARPEEFVTNQQARDLFKRRLRYIAARWASSPNLFAWEWWNEVNWTPIDDAHLRPWIVEMTAELRRFDPYRHLASTSYADGGTSSLWDMPELDFVQQHQYTSADLAQTLPAAYRALAQKAPDKPVLLSELGFDTANPDTHQDHEGNQLHDGLWAAPFGGFAGTAMHWWWDSYIDPRNKWSEYRSIALFMENENLGALTPGQAQAAPPGTTALTLQNETRALVWVRASASAVAQNAQLTVANLADGEYTAAWFSPQAAAWQAEQAVQVRGGVVTLAVPAFQHDLALRIAPR